MENLSLEEKLAKLRELAAALPENEATAPILCGIISVLDELSETIEAIDSDIDELYDLEADPAELNNLVYEPAHADTLAELRRELYHAFKAMDDPLMKTGFLDRQLLQNKKL